MDRNGSASLAAIALLVVVSHGADFALAQPADDSGIVEIHEAAAPLDTHADVLVNTTADIYRTDDGESQLTVAKLVAGGMATQVLAVQSPNGPFTEAGITAARAEVDAKISRVRALVAENSDRLGIAYSSSDIESLRSEGRVAILIGFQNAFALGRDLSLVEHYIDEGVRVFAFNHAGNNAFADSSRPTVPGEELNSGLSDIGRQALEVLNNHGVVVDVSQLTPRALMQTLQLSRAPVIASHSAVRALVNESRNLSDEELDAIAAADGAVCIPPFNTYLAPRPQEFALRLGEIRSRFGLPGQFEGVLDDSEQLSAADRGAYMGEALAAVPRATVEDYVDHIDYVASRIGDDHVCIGTDFDHGAGIIGYRDASDALNLTRAMVERGYSADRIRKIWSGNFLRVLRAAEASSERLLGSR